MARLRQDRLSGCFALAILVCLLGTARVAAQQYVELHSRAVRTCDAIDPSDYQAGLIFNPEGYRSFYVRSQCFQEAAVQFRDPTLCAQVRQRSSFFGSSWGYSAERCRRLVSDGAAADRTELERIKRGYAEGGVRLRDFSVRRNGNGRDTDIIPAFVGTYAHGYTLTFEILPADGARSPILLHKSGYHLDATSNLSIYIRQTDMRQRFPGFALNQPYTVRATVTLDVGAGGQSGYWSDAFIESVFPGGERTQSITRQAAF